MTAISIFAIDDIRMHSKNIQRTSLSLSETILSLFVLRKNDERKAEQD